jgi:hypothetical protein
MKRICANKALILGVFLGKTPLCVRLEKPQGLFARAFKNPLNPGPWQEGTPKNGFTGPIS